MRVHAMTQPPPSSAPALVILSRRAGSSIFSMAAANSSKDRPEEPSLSAATHSAFSSFSEISTPLEASASFSCGREINPGVVRNERHSGAGKVSRQRHNNEVAARSHLCIIQIVAPVRVHAIEDVAQIFGLLRRESFQASLLHESRRHCSSTNQNRVAFSRDRALRRVRLNRGFDRQTCNNSSEPLHHTKRYIKCLVQPSWARGVQHG